ncbi:MAG: hypothetical protein AB9846_10055 [Tenuifilaceae bacterium]
MRTYTSLLVFFVLIIQNIVSFAQFENIDLNKYKLTDYKYKTLSTSFNINNTNQYINSDAVTNEAKLVSEGNLNFNTIKYNRNYYGTKSIWFSLNNTFERSGNSITNLTENRINSSFGFNSTNNFYFLKDFFLGVNLQTSNYPSHSNTKHDYPTGTGSGSYNSGYSNNNLSFQIGKGRIEEVTDARLAIYILDDLLIQGRLSRIPNEEEVFAFADFITKLLNNRVIDSRIKRIKEFVAVDSFLVSNGLSTKVDGLYFGLINDNWRYARIGPGSTGTKWYLGVSPTLSYNYNIGNYTNFGIRSEIRNSITRYGLSLDAAYSSYWISGLKWQKGYWIGGSYNIYKYDTVGIHSGLFNYNTVSGQANYLISYLPNTRTYITIGSGILAFKFISKEMNDKLNIAPFISGSCNYYFSEKLRFQINAKVEYYFDKRYNPMITTKTLDYGINATLQYYIF